ncbi:hypothetical protein WJX72_006542 [[Myrmecia] bisecta]|uniref:Uncharacterized protein n=1 Tax=[Myrmecia] bisecta TaxID=41462 RepID=A0AAW1QFG0_9CHLO
MPMPTTVNGKPVKTGSWTVEEDRLLAEWQGKVGNRWSAVAKKIPGRTGQQCAQRWRHKVNPNIKKEKWTPSEDEALAALVAEFGNQWAEIARRLDGRTDQQCMGRWRRHLDPNIRREVWEAHEDEKLAEMYAVHGSQWSRISAAIPGRTAQQCRARWFQVEAGPTSGQKPVRKSARSPSRRASRRRSYASDGDFSDCEDGEEEEEEEEECLEDEWGGESDEDGLPPPEYSTPLRKAYARAMARGSDREASNARRTLLSPRSSDPGALERRSSGASRTSGRSTVTRHNISSAMPREDDSSGHASANVGSDRDADGHEGFSPPGRRAFSRLGGNPTPSRGQRAGLRGSPGMVQESPFRPAGHAMSMNAEAELLWPGGQRMDQASAQASMFASPSPRKRTARSPAEAQGAEHCQQSRMDPNSLRSPAKDPHHQTHNQGTPKRPPPAAGMGGRATPKTPRTNKAFQSPHPPQWRVSPSLNILSLLQSPHPSAKTDIMQSPGFKGLFTPDWAKRRLPDPQSAPPLYQPPEGATQLESEDSGSFGDGGRNSMGRGPVARKLNIEAALKGGAASQNANSIPPGRSQGLAHHQSSQAGEDPRDSGKCIPAVWDPQHAPLGTANAAAVQMARRKKCSPARRLKAGSPLAVNRVRLEGDAARKASDAEDSMDMSDGPQAYFPHHPLLRPGYYQLRPSNSIDTDDASDYMSASVRPADSEAEDSVLQAGSSGCWQLTDKENSACNALAQLSVLPIPELSINEASSMHPSFKVPEPEGQGQRHSYPDHFHDSAHPNADRARSLDPAALTGTTSSHVRMRLHALLEGL